MRLRLLLVLSCMGSAAATYAAEPSTRPAEESKHDLAHAEVELAAAVDNMAKAEATWRDVERAAREKLESQPDVAKAKAVMVDAKKKLAASEDAIRHIDGYLNQRDRVLNEMRTDHSAYFKAMLDYDLAVSLKLAGNAEVQKAFEDRFKANDALRRAKTAELEIRWTFEAEERAIDLAIREKRLAAGMTETQTEQAMGIRGIVVADGLKGKTLAWTSTFVGKGLRTTSTYARILDGLVVNVWWDEPKP